MTTAGRDIRDALLACLASEAGAEYNELKYLGPESLSQNSFNHGKSERYGVRPGATPRNDEAEVNRALTYTQTFQYVLTKGYRESAVSDSKKYEAFLDLHEIALRFNSKILRTKAGIPATVINAINFEVEEPLFLDDKVAVLTGNIDIIYRVSIG